MENAKTVGGHQRLSWEGNFSQTVGDNPTFALTDNAAKRYDTNFIQILL